MRRSGKTTRIIDNAVQQLFEGKTLLFAKKYYLNKVDYYRQVKLFFNTDYTFIVDDDPRFNDVSQRKLFDKFLNRIKSEHFLKLINIKTTEDEKGWIVNLENFERII
jgi:hypothetical protein